MLAIINGLNGSLPGPTWLSFSWGNLGCFVHVTGHTKKTLIKGKTGHCSALPGLESDRLSQVTLGHPQSPIKEKSDPPGHPRLERVVQSILPFDKMLVIINISVFVHWCQNKYIWFWINLNLTIIRKKIYIYWHVNCWLLHFEYLLLLKKRI